MGSEMCIRDRSGRPPRPRRASAALPSERSPAVGVRREGARRNPCLLYTSDAADERSSVDLGGRRIIKTKTRRRTSGNSRLIARKVLQ